MVRILILLLVLAMFASTVLASSYQGLLVSVSDGDTVQVMHDGKAEKIRLAEIDCPEMDQPYGQAAKRFVLGIAAQKTVRVEVGTTDRYGRTVGSVFLPDGSSLNRALVKEGYAWWYRQFSKDASIGQLETEARNAKRGLWQDKDPVAPWEWRRGKRAGAASSAAIYRGNTQSKVFHREGCKYFDCKNCTALFESMDKAITAGYRPCKFCDQ